MTAMNRLARILATTVTLLGIFNLQFPAPARCLMIAKTATVSCAMPCCAKSRIPLDCPKMEVQAPRDTIITSAPQLSTAFVVLHFVADGLSMRPSNRFTWLGSITEKCRQWLLIYQTPTRAPPHFDFTLPA